MIKKALQPLGLRIHLSHKGKHLKDLISSNKCNNIQPPCDLRKCEVKRKDCTRTHVVYEVKCNKCNPCYIGSTKRRLHQRIKEHLFMQKSSLVYQHKAKCKNDEWTTRILYTSHNIQQLRFMESILIKRVMPSINGKESVFKDHIVF